jgi:signal transduction histidine kinase
MINLFGISSIILSLSGLLFSFLVFRSDIKSKVNRYWFISCITFSLWSFSLYLVTSTHSITIALYSQYFLDISAIFLPATYFLFLSEFLRLKNYGIRLFCIFLAGAFGIFSITSFFKVGMVNFQGFFWVNPGQYYILFPIYFVIYALLSLSLMLRAYYHSKPYSLEKSQIRNMILGGIMGYGGGVTNFFPQFFSVYPYGNYLVIFYIVFMVYGVIRYKLLSSKVISAQLFSTALGLTTLINLLRSTDIGDILLNSFIFVLVIIFGLLLVGSVNKEVKTRERIEKLATDLQKANDRLTELDRQKSEFVSFATHQLRAPLTAMKGYASLILEGDLGVLSKELRDAVSRIFESSKTLASIVDDYLNLTRIELGSMKYAFETIDLKELVEDVIGEIKPNIEKTGLKFSFSADAKGMDFRVTADRDKLKQVIANLIDNSLKYTPSGSMDVTLVYDSTHHKYVFQVKDTGVGISTETMPKLFQKFSRADNANKTNIRGTGLGLYVAKEIVTAHHGTIHAESAGEGKGSTFIVELDPLANGIK